ncbi:MAG: hypothetical protein Q8L48_42340 [Archangium sp.]|nr:hypothetical protein [Archangium sp.]
MRHALFLALGLLACGKPVVPPEAPAVWQPGKVLRLDRAPNARGYVELRGLVHVHSIYSHDACDGAPHDDAGVYNQSCLEDFRRGVCQTQDDFFFLTDHGDSFADNEFPAVLLFDAARGDALVERAGGPVANWLACPGASPALIMGGTETETMPVGLEGHVASRGLYSSREDSALDTFHAQGGVTLVAHTEDWTVAQLMTMHLDGFEMFNLHRNALKNGGVAADLLLNYVDKGLLDGLMHPDLFLAAFNLDDDTYMTTWGTVLARGSKRVTTMGSDCHRNTFPQLLQDGERIDSYRRMMSAFSNHLLVKPKADGTWDDVELKEALKGGRNFGVFEFLGYAEGFDFVAMEGATPREIGQTALLANGVTLKAVMPKVRELDATADAPALKLVLFRAREGGWDEVSSITEGTLEFAVTQPGAYRVEVRMVPKHLRAFAGTRRNFFTAERPWVMTSALYVE